VRYSIRNKDVGETRTIQPFWLQSVAPTFPDAHFDLVDTHTQKENNTQDCTVYVKGKRSDSAIVLLIELVGQDLEEFPDKDHKQKIIRDLERVHSRTGRYRPIYAVITDLSRIQCVRYAGVNPKSGEPQLQKTVVADSVEGWLSAFANTSAEMLGYKDDVEIVVNSERGKREIIVSRGRQLGHGAHATVYQNCDNDKQFIKQFTQQEYFDAEVSVLRKLKKKKKQTGVPTLVATEEKSMVYVATPVGHTMLHGREHDSTCLMALTGVSSALRAAHEEKLVHRDVRPSNIIFVDVDESKVEGILLDWAAATPVNVQVSYSGTKHYASHAVLLSLAKNTNPMPTCADDWESLVYTFYERGQPIEFRIELLRLSKYEDIAQFWQTAQEQQPRLSTMVAAARRCDVPPLLDVKNWMMLWGRIEDTGSGL
jgi:hypothetical protein